MLKLAPRGLDYVFFSDSGSTSVEVALKMALGYWHNIGEPRSRIVVMQHSYHGDTIGAMSVGARGVFNAAYGPLLFDVTTVPFPLSRTGAGDAGCARGCLSRQAGRLHRRAIDPRRRRDADVSGMGAEGDEADLRSRRCLVHCR